MAWSIDQIENILAAGFMLVAEAGRLGFDRDASLALEFHGV